MGYRAFLHWNATGFLVTGARLVATGFHFIQTDFHFFATGFPMKEFDSFETGFQSAAPVSFRPVFMGN